MLPPSSSCIQPSGPITEEQQAARHLYDLIWRGAALDAFEEGFEHAAPLVITPANQISLLVLMVRGLHLHRPAAWRGIGERLQLCQKAGWHQTADWPTRLGDLTDERRYYDLWDALKEDNASPWGHFARVHTPFSPADLDALGNTLSLFLTLLPPPLGVTCHSVDALHQLHFPLMHAVRLGLKHQTLPRFSESVVRDHLLTGLFSGRLLFADTCVGPLGQMLFQEVHAWTENLSPSFFEDVLQQFMKSDYISLREGHSRKLSQEEKKIGHALMRCAQRLHTAALLTQDMAPASAHRSPRQRL